MKSPKHYRPAEGDTFIEIREITPEHRGRIFEARDQKTGQGILGYLEDANHYLLDGVVGLRFYGQPLGLFDVPTAKILLKAADYENAELGAPPSRNVPPVR